jgi:hypothetical protein
MREVFSQHFATDPDRREKLWENCLFVFDTNVLTGIYRRSEEARDAQYKLMRALGDRLWIPHRVIYEFLDNRAKIVHDQAQLYAASINELQGMLSGFEVVTKHPFLSAEVYREFNLVSQKVLAELEASREFHDGRITNDDVKDVLAEILVGKVGFAFAEDRLAEIVKEGEQRYAQNVPPGFEDKGKHKGSTITEEIRKRYGDLIIWYQVIEKAKAEQRPVILVTGDQKPDWWAEQSGKKMGPLPALIEEFKSLSGQDFYLYSYHGFLDFANKHLDQKTSESVIEEVRESALMDAEASEEQAYKKIDETIGSEVFHTIFDDNGRFYSADYVPPSHDEYRVLIEEEVKIIAMVNELECKVDEHKSALKSSLRGKSRLSAAAMSGFISELNMTTSKLAVMRRQLNVVRRQLQNLRMEK